MSEDWDPTVPDPRDLAGVGEANPATSRELVGAPPAKDHRGWWPCTLCGEGVDPEESVLVQVGELVFLSAHKECRTIWKNRLRLRDAVLGQAPWRERG